MSFQGFKERSQELKGICFVLVIKGNIEFMLKIKENFIEKIRLYNKRDMLRFSIKGKEKKKFG